MSLDVHASHPELEPNLLDDEPGTPVDANATAEPASIYSDFQIATKNKHAEPVTQSERFFAIDVTRGFALLGILAMNIVGFGWPGPAYSDPFRGGGFDGLDRGVWFFNHMFFEAKMMTIFSMLFGAGLVLMDQRAEARSAKLTWIYYRRIFWLLAIGLVHSYLIWDGDILVLYASTGLFLYFFRTLTPKVLISLGISAMLILVPIVLAFGAVYDLVKATTAQANAVDQPRTLDRQIRDAALNFLLHDIRDEIVPSPEKKAEQWNKELAAYRGGYVGIVKHKAHELLVAQVFGFLFGAGFFAGSRMLIGMGLMKLGVFSAQRSRKFYLWMLGLGYGIGLPLMIFDAIELIGHRFSADYFVHGGVFYNAFGSVIVAMGHVGLLMLIVQSGALGWLTTRLAAVGRMALSNYLFDSIACTTLFYGYGFGLFGTINRAGLAAIVLTFWIIQLLASPIWLKHFRYGPAEWLWRSLTYWQFQPMRQRPAVDLVIAA